MQIDFHLGITYVLARLSGFSPFEANTIASSSQYVDDAVHSGTILFDNESAYEFSASAHRMLDYRNFKELANHRVWIPFHFIPGNQVTHNKATEQVQKLICRPNSEIAQDIVKHVVANFQRPYGYHLLGVTTHAYADTWAHQGFAGITHEINKVHDIFDEHGDLDHEMMNYRKKYFKRSWYKRIADWVMSYFVSEANPIGHGGVLSYPDLPYLRWSYRDWKNEIIQRNNPQDYMEAIRHVLEMYRLARIEAKLQLVKIQDRDLLKIQELIETIRNEEPEERLKQWEAAILCGAFSFGTDTWKYSSEGSQSWLAEAFDIVSEEDFALEDVPYKASFLNSNWKLMHDALKYYRFCVLHEVLPRYEICVA
ncbi:DUF6765 family protein [Bdellovibrio bacteriovorus]